MFRKKVARSQSQVRNSDILIIGFQFIKFLIVNKQDKCCLLLLLSHHFFCII